MNAVNSTTDKVTNLFAAGGAQSGAVSPRGADASDDNGQDRFLALLVAQMKNQDPLNPLDNAQVTSQLAQINTVSGIAKLNHTLEKLIGAADSAQTLQAAGLVGHDVLSAGTRLDLGPAGAAAGFDLAGDADQVIVTVNGPSGQVVHRATMAGLAAGVHGFEWDGRTDAGAAAAPGRYTFTVAATQAGKDVTAEALAVSRVEGVSRGSGGLVVGTTSGPIDWARIKQVM